MRWRAPDWRDHVHLGIFAAGIVSHNRFLAIGWLAAGVFIFSLQDVVIKTVSGSYPVHQVIFFRCVSALPFLFYLCHKAGGIGTILSPRWRALSFRSIFLLFSYTSYFLAFPVMKLADIIGLYATVPLFVTALAGPILGEKIPAIRWAVVVIGFVGALIMVGPGSGVFDFASILPIFSAFSYALAQVLARRIGLADSAAVMSFYQNLLYLAASAALALIVTAWGGEFHGHRSLEFLLRQWVMPDLRDFLLIAACGPIAAIGMTMLGQAYRLAEANLVASLEYTGIIWGTAWGFLIWGEVQRINSFIGAAIIVLAGLSLIFVGSPKSGAADLREPQ